MKRFLYLLISLTIIYSCESSSEEEDLITEIPDEELSVLWAYAFSNGDISDNVHSFNEAYWDGNGIHFENSSLEGVNWIEIEDVIITGTGQIGLLENPYARLSRQENGATVIYSTDVRPNFWIDPPNSAQLILGGSGFTVADYQHNGGFVIQGGYLKITDYNERYIAGECFFVGWVFNNQLNREVMTGAYMEFSGVEYKP